MKQDLRRSEKILVYLLLMMKFRW